MKEIVVISGKGGTGKTVLTASFAVLAKNKVMVDCDVDAADLHLLLHPTVKKREEFRSGQTAIIDQDKCIQCGKCLVLCRFEAVKAIKNEKGGLKKIKIDPVFCEGCGVCYHACPVDAVKMEENVCGELFISETKHGPFVHAKLGVAEENSGKLVAKVRQAAKDIAVREDKDYVIIDGPPGIGCPVIASLSGVNTALVVTEPTLSGIHDMERVIHLASHFKTNVHLCINKFDVNLENTSGIEKYARDNGIEIAGKIPYEEKVMKSVVQAVPLPEFLDGELLKIISRLWERIKE
ncbi:MAG: ATP-binding protein [Candidatus Omnitrophota bacterium]